uniref:Receptor expression-enhancing protein n=1 Tax=Plectus sambesii TaxID=2011161 RepID=A0A914VD12_9BILA
MLFVLWLLSPWTKGASILYRKWIHPTLAKHERGIDAFLDQAKNEGYNTVLRLGSQGLLCARDIVTTAAVRGQMQLVQQIQRSVSLNDVTDGAGQPRQRIRIEEIREEADDAHASERVWQGTYEEGGNLVEEEFRYLDEQEDGNGLAAGDPAQAPRRSSRQRPAAPSDRYATLPRSSSSRTVKKRPDLY